MTKATRHKVYVASSWRNPIQQDVVRALKEDGHDVYDFRNPSPGEQGFGWKSVTEVPPAEWTAEHFSSQVLDHPVAARGFEMDMSALRACSACVLVLPCGRSAHLELGFAVGHGRLSIVYMPKLDEPELMYRMCDYLETTIDGVRRQLSRDRDRPRWQHDLAASDARFPDAYPGKQYEGPSRCGLTQSRYRTRSEQESAEARFGGPLPERGPCREYFHRECFVCGGCWRHGSCTCGPEVVSEPGVIQ